MKMEKGKQTTRDIQAEERRMQLLDTALTVFATKGFNHTSMRDLARKANISQGLIYHYFSGKEQLLEATLEYFSFLPQLKQILKEKRDRPLDEVAEVLAINFSSLLDQKSNLVKIFIQEAQLNSNVRKMWSNLCCEGASLLKEYIELHIQRGEIRPHNAEITARSLFSIIFMYHFTKDVFQFNIDREVFIKEALTNFLKGIEQVKTNDSLS
jgi:AcrR family transcriptional regulator